MPEAMLPALVLVLCSERGRSERAGARGMSTARSTPVSTVWLRLSDQELMEIQLAEMTTRRCVDCPAGRTAVSSTASVVARRTSRWTRYRVNIPVEPGHGGGDRGRTHATRRP